MQSDTRAKFRHALRIAGGLSLPLIAGEALGWSLPFLGSIFALQLLAVRRPVLSLSEGVVAVLGLAIVFNVASVVTSIALPSPIVFASLISLVVFLAFYALARTASPVWFMMLIAMTVLPVIANQSKEASSELISGLTASMACAIATVWLVFALFPEPEAITVPAKPDGLPAEQAGRMALTYTLVVMPLLLLLLFQNSTFVIVMMTTLAIIQASAKVRSARAATGIVVGNVIAGLIAGFAYFLIESAPTLPFLAAIVILISLLFGAGIAAADERSPLVAVMASATFILLGLGLTPFMDTSTAFASRVAGVVLASLYCVGMLAILLPRTASR